MEHFEHNPGDHEDPTPETTWLMGVVAVVLLVVIFLGLIAMFRMAVEEEVEDKSLGLDFAQIKDLDEKQNARLTRPSRWEVVMVEGVEQERHLVIPIEDAMQRIAAEHAGGTTP